MICPQRYRTHTGSSPERQTLRIGAQPIGNLRVVGGLPWCAAPAALTGDVMRRARYTPATPAKVISYGVGGIVRSAADSFGCASHKGEELRPATPAKVFKREITLHRSSSGANRHLGARAAGQKPRRTGGGYPDRRRPNARLTPRALPARGEARPRRAGMGPRRPGHPQGERHHTERRRRAGRLGA